MVDIERMKDWVELTDFQMILNFNFSRMYDRKDRTKLIS